MSNLTMSHRAANERCRRHPRRCWVFGLVVAAAWLLPALSWATEGKVPLTPPAELRFPALRFAPPQPQRAVLGNGIVVYLFEDHELPLITVHALARTGSVYAPDDKVGLARLTGTVLRSGGTERREPEALNERLEFLAASVESSFGPDSGTVTLSALSKDFDEVLEIFDDLLRQPAFREEKLELARRQMIEGIRRQNDNANSIAFREFRRLVYPGHPRGRSPSIETVSRLSRADVVEFYRRFFYPRNLMLAVSGDFESAGMLAKLERVLGTWREERPAVAAPPPPRGETSPSLNLASKELPQSTIVIGHLTVAENHPDFYPFTVLNTILGGGFSSKLVSKVRAERGLAYSVGSFYRGDIDYGVFAAYAQTKSQSTVEVIQLLRRILQEATEGKISEDDLAWAKESIINRFIFSFSSPEQVVMQQLQLEFKGLPEDSLRKYRDRIANVTLADLQRVAKRFLYPQRSIALVVGDARSFAEPLSSLGQVQTITLPVNDQPGREQPAEAPQP